MIHQKKGDSVAVVAMGQSSIEWFARHYRHGSQATYADKLNHGFAGLTEEYHLNAEQVEGLQGIAHDISVTQAERDMGPQYDEVWAISHMGGELLEVDMIFAMDDMRLKGSHWPRSVNREVPLMTSTVYPEFERAVRYPIEDVVEDFGTIYFKNTASYALAYAIHKGYKRVGCFGIDFFYQNSKLTERGMGCFTYWAGRAHERGVSLDIAHGSATMDMDQPNKLYGYAVQPELQLSDGVLIFDEHQWAKRSGGASEEGEGKPSQEDLSEAI